MPDAEDVVPEGDVYKTEMLHSVSTVGRATLDYYRGDVREILDTMYLRVDRMMHEKATEREYDICGDIQFTIQIQAVARCAPSVLELTEEQRKRIDDEHIQTIIVAPRDMYLR